VQPAEEVSPRTLDILYNHVSVSLAYHNLGEEILTFPERRPRTFNVLLATVKTWTADAVVQSIEKRRNSSSFDWQRSLAFATFGLLYVGLLQWVLYVSLLTWLFPDAMVFANAPFSVKVHDRIGQIELLGQVLVDNFVFGVLIYFPVFYMIKELVQGDRYLSLHARLQIGLHKYWRNIVHDNLASLALWIPAGIFIFAAPMFLRMPLEHGVSFGWTMFMSATRGSADESKGNPEEKVLEVLEIKSEAKC